jgi:glycerophosphoryl diester phosphodiesterase
MPALIRVGHRGAPAVAPANTLAGFDAALAIGVDMIEFDVIAGERTRELFVAHDRDELEAREPLPLADALTHLASTRYAGVRLQLDIKSAGLEREVIAALDASGTRPRAFVSTGDRGVLRRVRSLAPEVPLGWTLPEMSLIADSRLLAATLGRLYLARLPTRVAALISAGEIDAIVPAWRIVTRRLIDAVRAAGGESYVWTVDDRRTIERLAGLGVTGVISNDPRLFGSIEQTAAL